MKPLKPGDLCIALIDESGPCRAGSKLVKKGDTVTVVSRLIPMHWLTAQYGHEILAPDGRKTAAQRDALEKIEGQEYDGDSASSWGNIPFFRPSRSKEMTKKQLDSFVNWLSGRAA
jgi:hypothetical protein